MVNLSWIWKPPKKKRALPMRSGYAATAMVAAGVTTFAVLWFLPELARYVKTEMM